MEERPFGKKTSEYSLPNLIFTYLLNGVFEKMMKIVSYFQFIIIASHFGMILQKSIMVEISNTSIAKASVRKRWL